MKESPSTLGTLTSVSADRRKRLRRLVVFILLVSIGVHVIGGLGAGIWVIARYLARPESQFVVKKEVQMKAEDREHRLQMEEVSSLRPKPVYNNRIQSIRPTKLALPELPKVPLEAITPIDTEGLISDQVEGMGKYGQGNGGDSGGGFFGGKGAVGSGLLAGNFYDLKKDENEQPTAMAKEAPPGQPNLATPAYLDIVNKLSRSASTDSVLRHFYKAPETLYLAKLAIPISRAEGAPKAFEVADKVKPRYWIAVYKGRMTAPETGSFRFIGFADDILLVKVNRRLVLDGSLLGATPFHGKEGISFQVQKGKPYDIEIIIGECPGGYFSAWLQIEKVRGGDGPYWFRMSDAEVGLPDNHLPGDKYQKLPTSKKNGPVWWPAAKKEMPGLGL